MSGQNLQGKKFIIIEDNTFLSNVIAQKLTIQGATALTYTNGLEGLAAIRTEQPDLVLLDILMPIMNGYEVLQVLHTEGIIYDIPVIVISNSGQPVEIERIKSLGVREYLIKADFEPDDVLKVIYKTLDIEQVPAAVVPDPIISTSQPIPAAKVMPKVLVVEDDPLLRNLLSMKLSATNCPSMFSNDGLHVPEMALSFLPDVIVLDLKLPGKDGFEVLQELKQTPGLEQIPVVIFSNNSSDDDKHRATELGAAAFHVKAMTDLSDFIHELVDLVKK